MQKFKAYINGKFVTSEKQVNIISPLNLEVIGSVPSLSPLEIDFAFEAAQKALSPWQNLTQEKRNEKIMLFKNKMLAHKAEIAKIMHLEIGKEITDAISEIERTASYIDQTIKTWSQLQEDEIQIANKKVKQWRLPVGVVLAISPFNYPVNLSLSKIIPALISGNTIVFKAATNGSLTGGYLAKLWDQVNLLPGVFNYVCGAGKDIGDILVMHHGYQMISFTGSIPIGKKIAKHAAMKGLVLELGGNDAAYVRHDANLDLAIKEVKDGSFGFAGQRCTAIKRLILHQDIATNFITKLEQEVRKMKMEPVINKAASTYLKSLWKEALTQKYEIILAPTFENNYVSAGLIKTTSKTRLWNEEQFGPILPIVIVKNDEEAISLINQTNFGLQNSLFTNDLTWATQIALKIASGSVNINGKSSRGPDQLPFLGIKDSGWGVQGIKDALISMTRIHNIVINK